uniref:Uncharacterized protein n=1 Tax=Cacopsylla melanoneura TaxID=428564 RepID=A0A8D8YWR5_9HEMI
MQSLFAPAIYVFMNFILFFMPFHSNFIFYVLLSSWAASRKTGMIKPAPASHLNLKVLHQAGLSGVNYTRFDENDCHVKNPVSHFNLKVLHQAGLSCVSYTRLDENDCHEQ